MKFRSVAASSLLAGLGALLLNGCGSTGPELAAVSGIVTLDGQPLAGATVEFQPPKGSPSTGVTDSSGAYRLAYTARKQGAMLGKHSVRITFVAEKTDAEGNSVASPQLLPPKYNRNSELTAEVKPGSNKLDFQLNGR
ncbi:MAG: carboxypeptidase regulatory-like domain-containing protein [Pirellulales bacterium]|nr:carboxypeptidase regulatory-like domain-containing protein [Pirellulales bacterium]